MRILERINIAMDELRVEREEIASKLWDEYDSWRHVISTYWECDDSPLDFCVYDHWEDPAHDNCLFCGEPEERK